LNISQNPFIFTLGACVFFASACRTNQGNKTEVDAKVLDAKTDGRQRGKQSLTTILAAGTEDDHSLGRSHISAGANSDTTETVMASL
jgi:hypothetical protein